MSKYDPNNLISDLIKDLKNQLNPFIFIRSGSFRPASDADYVKTVEISKEHIKFYLYDYFRNINDSKVFENLSKIWSNRIFKGKNGYYKFGDIIKEGVLFEIPTSNKKEYAIQFPFYKLKNYGTYYDILPTELNLIIISKLSSNNFLKIS